MQMKRVGSFMISDRVFFNLDDEGEKSIKQLLGTVFITSATHNFGYGRFEYIGFCDEFEEVLEGCMAPAYSIEMSGSDCFFHKINQ